jgi:RNA polymerase sigma-70 factor (ECF subfamily)
MTGAVLESAITNIKLGDQEAFRLIYKEFYIGLCIHANRFLHKKESAEEIVQEVFLRFWERRESIDIQETIGAYLFQSVRNACLNHLKHLQVEQKFQQEVTDMLKEAEDFYTITQENGQSIYLARELEHHINTAIEGLPEQCREIFKMSRFDGFRNQEIADKKGITIHTVQKQISIALEKLRVVLTPYLKIITPFLTIWRFF